MLEVVGIAGRAVVGILAGEVVGVLAHVERADQDAPGRFQPRERSRIGPGRRAIAIDLGAGARRQAFDVEQVLDRERRPREWPQALPARPGRVDRVGLGERADRRDVSEGAKRCVLGFDAAEGFLCDLARARGAGSDRLGDGSSRSVQERRRHGVNTGAGSS